jgi:hypothetical protein
MAGMAGPPGGMRYGCAIAGAGIGATGAGVTGTGTAVGADAGT